MFVKSIKFRFKKLACIAFIGVIALIGSTIAYIPQKVVETVASVSAKSSKGETAEDREEFLKSYGWEISKDPSEITEVLIPSEFNNIYEEYNIIQKKQGFDLNDYRGKKVKKWCYKVLNYPKEDVGEVYATLLILDGNIIGGDISSAEKGKIMHGFTIE